MDFPYLIVHPGVFEPIVSLDILSKEGKWVKMEAYVDSGATYSIFDAGRAHILGLKLSKGKRTSITVGDGNKIAVYLFRLPVRFAGHFFSATIGFSEKLGVGFNLLGRHSFFDRFRICFNDRERILQTTFLG